VQLSLRLLLRSTSSHLDAYVRRPPRRRRALGFHELSDFGRRSAARYLAPLLPPSAAEAHSPSFVLGAASG
jgi:hypothetical protein